MSKRKKNGENGVYENGNKMNGNGKKSRISVTARSQHQKELLKSIKENVITIVQGPPGSGKTMLSVVSGLREFTIGRYSKLIFTRPCVEANGENLGFLPGDLHEKIHPYMYPIFDFLADYLSQKQIEGLIKSENIVTLPLAFQRGMTFKNSFVLLDEAQNTKPDQIRMFLTRIGENCKVVITGDPLQSDIKHKNGLVDACERLVNIDKLGIVEFTKEDIVRHPIVAEIEERYKKDQR